MDTKSGYPFWVISNGLLSHYPRLERDARCDVLVVGGGITAALIADELSRRGHDVIVVERRDLGWGSTAASTALLQYESDVHMTDLARRYDEVTAALAYRSGVDAVDGLVRLGTSLRDVGLMRTDSIYLASAARHVTRLADEARLRQRYGLPCKLLGGDEIAERYDLTAPAALHTRCAAVLDPYRFTCKLFARMHRRGVAIYDRSRIAELHETSRGVTATTDEGFVIRAGHAVIACGFETTSWLREKVARLRSTYVSISDPVAPLHLAKVARTIVWETARPYHYVRTTTDHRVLVGGEDDATDRPARRDRRLHRRERALVEYFRKLLPDVPYTPAFAWAGTFAETADGLPYFGAHRERGPRTLFAMAYGGNGITYSYLGAGLVGALVEREPHPLRDLFAFGR